jgi:hypothetical protein
LLTALGLTGINNCEDDEGAWMGREKNHVAGIGHAKKKTTRQQCETFLSETFA